jgi:DNA-binding MarR family transcriptional regulator
VQKTRKTARTAAPAPSLGFLIADVLRLMRGEFRRQATGLQLTPALSRLLLYVDQRPGCSQAELAAYLDVTSVTIGRMIDRLERCGYLLRRADANDRRTFRIHLGKAARPLVGRMNTIVTSMTRHATRGLTRAECDALMQTLQRLRGNLLQGAA